MTTAQAGSRHRFLAVANTTCAGSELFREIRERADETETGVLIVAAAPTSRVWYRMSDEAAGTAAAQRRLAASIAHCEAAGVAMRDALGDADPPAATDDTVRSFHPDEIIKATHPSERSNWLGHGVVAQTRERFGVPITHIEVDEPRDDAHVVAAEPADRRAAARDRHTTRDWVILAGAVVLFILSSVLTGVFDATGAPGWLIATWFIVCDLGVKAFTVVALWMLFQRRPRADLLNHWVAGLCVRLACALGNSALARRHGGRVPR
jgi:hypothetical protein